MHETHKIPQQPINNLWLMRGYKTKCCDYTFMMADLYIFWTQKKEDLLTQSMLYFQLFDQNSRQSED